MLVSDGQSVGVVLQRVQQVACLLLLELLDLVVVDGRIAVEDDGSLPGVASRSTDRFAEKKKKIAQFK